jgi:Predicted membrane protein
MKKKRAVPHTYVIIFVFILFCAALTWLVPGGEYVEVAKDNGSGTLLEFRYLEAQPQAWQVFVSLYKGFVRQAGIIAFILIIGGTFWIVNSGRAIDAGIHAFLKSVTRLERYGLVRRLGVGNIIIVLVMLMFSLFGAIFGMSEETIAFVVILIPLAISLGYDSLVGLGMVYLAAHVGFAGALLNPFTIGIAQGLSGLPLFSGIEYRLFCWVVLNILVIVFILRYAAKVKRNPLISPVYQDDEYWRAKKMDLEEAIVYHTPPITWITYGLTLLALILFSVYYPSSRIEIGNSVAVIPYLIPALTLSFAIVGALAAKKSKHFFVLTLLGYTIVFLVVGVMGYGWYIGEISGLFLALGILGGMAMGDKPNLLSTKFIDGAKDLLSAALIVGLAGGIIVILEDGKIIGTILYKMSQAMNGVGKVASVEVMYVIQTMINVIIPSGSAKAALTMPIMAPFSDLIGVSRQATVMAYQLGDGFTSMLAPTSGVLMGVLGVARVPYGKWVGWIWKFILLLVLMGALLLIPTVLMTLNGF